jgi:hypothetical protein
MKFPESRITLGIPDPKDKEYISCEEMRRRIWDASHDSHLIRNALWAADAQGKNGEDRYTMLAYQALIQLEIFWRRTLDMSALMPSPSFVMKDPTT